MDDLFDDASAFFQTLQANIIEALETLEDAEGSQRRFHRDEWNYDRGDGGGLSCILQNGELFEKAGVNFSRVVGEFPKELAESMPGAGSKFAATGVSLVIHPKNPHVPTVHANFRHIQKGTDPNKTRWFGGGADLTPYYPVREDVVHFHRTWKEVCDRHHVADYPRFKQWCDEYFYLPHRNEARGVGGIFFDHLKDDLTKVYLFVKDAGNQFLEAYLPIVNRRKDTAYDDHQRHWQLVRRGRYVEFNLLYDRGTKFGLQTGGRTESILMSLPPRVCWSYGDEPREDSEEAKLAEFLKPADWAG